MGEKIRKLGRPKTIEGRSSFHWRVLISDQTFTWWKSLTTQARGELLENFSNWNRGDVDMLAQQYSSTPSKTGRRGRQPKRSARASRHLRALVSLETNNFFLSLPSEARGDFLEETRLRSQSERSTTVILVLVENHTIYPHPANQEHANTSPINPSARTIAFTNARRERA